MSVSCPLSPRGLHPLHLPSQASESTHHTHALVLSHSLSLSPRLSRFLSRACPAQQACAQGLRGPSPADIRGPVTSAGLAFRAAPAGHSRHKPPFALVTPVIPPATPQSLHIHTLPCAGRRPVSLCSGHRAQRPGEGGQKGTGGPEGVPTQPRKEHPRPAGAWRGRVCLGPGNAGAFFSPWKCPSLSHCEPDQLVLMLNV